MITGVVIAKNEAQNIKDCLKTLSFCSQTLVIDNNSTDQTSQIAKKLGAIVIKTNHQNDYSFLRNFALKHVTTPWVLFVDADERVPNALDEEILKVLPKTTASGFNLHRQDHLWGKTIKYGDVGQVRLLRLGKKDAGIWQGQVHETWQIPNPQNLNSPLLHYPHQNLIDFLSRLNYYSSLRAQELQKQGKKSYLISIVCYPLGKFIYLWLFKLGFLDGLPGLVHALAMSFYSFLVKAKLYLLSVGVEDPLLKKS